MTLRNEAKLRIQVATEILGEQPGRIARWWQDTPVRWSSWYYIRRGMCLLGWHYLREGGPSRETTSTYDECACAGRKWEPGNDWHGYLAGPFKRNRT